MVVRVCRCVYTDGSKLRRPGLIGIRASSPISRFSYSSTCLRSTLTKSGSDRGVASQVDVVGDFTSVCMSTISLLYQAMNVLVPRSFYVIIFLTL
jgi:hypothetical protein